MSCFQLSEIGLKLELAMQIIKLEDFYIIISIKREKGLGTFLMLVIE